MNRPTYRELDKKLTEAKGAVSEGSVNLINPEAVAVDAIELGYRIDDELLDALDSVLDVFSPDDYVGGRPPARSYENKIVTSDLYAFRAESGRFDCQIYFKFTMIHSELWVISFHKNRHQNNARGKKK